MPTLRARRCSRSQSASSIRIVILANVGAPSGASARRSRRSRNIARMDGNHNKIDVADASASRKRRKCWGFGTPLSGAADVSATFVVFWLTRLPAQGTDYRAVFGHSTRAYGALQTAQRVRRLPAATASLRHLYRCRAHPCGFGRCGGICRAMRRGSLVARVRLCDKAGVTSGPA